MKLSAFEDVFERTINELQLVLLRSLVVNSFINQNKERIETDTRVGHELMTGGVSFRDITLPKGVNNLFLNPNYYRLNRRNLTNEVDLIMSREFLLYVAQAYEILESYLYDQVAQLVLERSTFHLFIEPKSSKTSFAVIRKSLKSLDDRINNRHLLRILRANCEVYAKHEKQNIYDLDYTKWMEMLSVVRHSVTHKQMEITTDELNSIKIMYDRYFLTRMENKKQLMFLQHGNCHNLITNIADFVYFVYKAVVEACDGEKVTLETIYPLLSYKETVGYLDPVEKWLAEGEDL